MFQLRPFLVLLIVDITVLGSLTFLHIKRAEKISKQAHRLQWKLFAVVCAQVIFNFVF